MWKVGVVGTGQFARKHINEWLLVDRVQLVGIYGRSEQHLSDVAGRYGVQAYSDLSQLAQNCDIVDIVSRNEHHYYDAQVVIPHIKALLVEKPITTDVHHAEQLLQQATQAGVCHSVISQFRFTPVFQLLKQYILSGEMGIPLSGQVTLVWPRSLDYFKQNEGWRAQRSKAGGGALLHQGIHYIDLLHWLFGSARGIHAHCEVGDLVDLCRDPVERTFTGTLKFDSGMLCQLIITTQENHQSANTMRFWGTKGSMLVQGNHLIPNLDTSPIKGVTHFMKSVISKQLKLKKQRSPLWQQFENVVDALEKKQSSEVCFEDGVRALKTINELYTLS